MELIISLYHKLQYVKSKHHLHLIFYAEIQNLKAFYSWKMALHSSTSSEYLFPLNFLNYFPSRLSQKHHWIPHQCRVHSVDRIWTVLSHILALVQLIHSIFCWYPFQIQKNWKCRPSSWLSLRIPCYLGDKMSCSQLVYNHTLPILDSKFYHQSQ